MKRQLKKWTFRITTTGIFLIGMLVLFMLQPGLLYSNKTIVGNYYIYHNKQIDPAFYKELEQAQVLIKSSELYDSSLKMDICLNDGSKYPKLIKSVLGDDMLISFYNKSIFSAPIVNYNSNYFENWGHRWNLVQMLAHAQTHSLEFNTYGLWNSNPLGHHANWKWEGYPEYISRQNPGQRDLPSNIETLLKAEHTNNDGWIKFADSTETLIPYYEYRLMIQYCMDVRKMTFVKLLADTTREENVRTQMMDWYKGLNH